MADHSGTSDRLCAGRKSRAGPLKTSWAGDVPPERGAFRNIRILLTILFSFYVQELHDCLHSFNIGFGSNVRLGIVRGRRC